MAKSSRAARREERSVQRQKRRRNRWIGIGAVMVLLAVVIYFTVQETSGGGALPADTVADPAIGPATAAVEIVEFADFGCPACRSWHNAGIREQIMAMFGDQVRFVWKDFPVITPLSPQAAEAGQCAGAQGKFWAYHDVLYEGYAGLETGALQRYASQVELDLETFSACLDQGLMRNKVRANEQEARRLGLRGTPGFALNGRALAAPPSFEQLSVLVQQELAAR